MSVVSIKSVKTNVGEELNVAIFYSLLTAKADRLNSDSASS